MLLKPYFQVAQNYVVGFHIPKIRQILIIHT